MSITDLSKHLLIIDDDERLRALLSEFLSSNGFKVKTAENTNEARSFIAHKDFDLVIIDIMLPCEDGITLLKDIRMKNETLPIILLTARDCLNDKIEGLAAGADDYITKPFEPLELVARIRSIFRRTKTNDDLYFSNCRFSLKTGNLFKDNKVIYLSSTELSLLKILAKRPYYPFSREQLAKKAGYYVSEETINVQIARLRQKIGDSSREPQFIKTIRHIGYAVYPDNRDIKNEI
ncbi:MAG: response regulator [Alphaproteobacteria bacterium]